MTMPRGPRRRTLPRERPAPEHNIVQNPELIRRLQQFLGLRQAHVAPALSDGVMPVVILGDVGQRREFGGFVSAGTQSQDGNGVLFSTAALTNPIGSGVKARVKRMYVSCIGSGSQNAQYNFSFTSPPAGLNGAPGNNGFEDGGSIQDHSPGNPDAAFYPVRHTPRCFAGGGRIAAATQVTPLFTVNVNDINTALYLWEFENLTIYGGMALTLQAVSNLAVFGHIGVSWEWSEEPLSP